jgi:opacity protein-like surface antigen
MVLLVGGMLGAGPLHGQARGADRSGGERPPRLWLGITLQAADPQGEFGALVDDGFGLELNGRFPVVGDGILSLRLDGGFLIYGNERQALCFPPPVGCRVGVDLTTTNSIATVGVGPEITVPGPVSPYINAGVGLSYFVTSSSLDGADDFDDRDLFRTRNYSDLVTAARVGGGIRFRVGRTGGGPVLVDIGAEYHRNGIAEYLRRGDILDHPDGTITLFPNRTEANLVTFELGVSFALGGGRPERR